MSDNIEIENNVLTVQLSSAFPRYHKNNTNRDGASQLGATRPCTLILSTKDIKHFMPFLEDYKTLYIMSPTKTLEAIKFFKTGDVDRFIDWCKEHVNEA